MQALKTKTAENQALAQNNASGQVLHAEDKFAEKKIKDHHEQTLSNLARLHDLVSGHAGEDSLAAMEGLAAEEKSPQKNFDLKSLLRDTIPELGLGISSAMHLTAAFAKATNVLPKSITEFFNTHALTASKGANLWNYAAKGFTALKNGRSWDGIGRLAYIIPSFASLENFFLFSGISSGITMMEQGHMDKVKPSKNIFEDFANNSKAFVEKIKEVYKHGIFNKNSLVFRRREIEEKHKGTMFVSAFGNFFGAVLGMIAPDKDSKLRKLAAIVRNVGGLGCDWGKFTHPDPNNRYSAIAYLGVSVLDVVQTFTPEPFATVLSHFGLTINNLANYFYVNTSKARDDNEFKHQAEASSPLKDSKNSFNELAPMYLLAS